MVQPCMLRKRSTLLRLLDKKMTLLYNDAMPVRAGGTSLFTELHCDPVQGGTGVCKEPPVLKTGSLQYEQDLCKESRFFSVIKADFPCNKSRFSL